MTLPTPTRAFPRPGWAGTKPEKHGNYANEIAVRGEKLFQKIIDHLAITGGSADAITASCSPPLLADPVDGQLFQLVAAEANGGAVTINIDSRGAIDLKDYAGVALSASDYVAGETLQFRYDGDAEEFRLTHRTLAQQVAAATAAVGDTSPLEQFGDSGSLGTVAQVEFTFTAGRYTHVYVNFSDLFCTGATLTVSLRNSGGAIVSLTPANGSGDDVRTGRAEFAIGLIQTTKVHTGILWGTDDTAEHEAVRDSGSHATAPDRVRVVSNGNITSGRVMAYGLRASL